ncbi:MAG: PAS domain S-box protein [Ignavibacteriae bacterium]|nr:PAS domain S-box protein [Ignavibacteriota bacterium]
MKHSVPALSSVVDERLFELIIGQVDDLIAIVDAGGNKLYFSPSYHRIYGDHDLFESPDFFRDIHAHDCDTVRQAVQETVRTGQSQCLHYRIIIHDEQVRHLESKVSILRSGNGYPARLLVVSHDVTEQREAEYTQRLLAQALTSTRDCFCLTDLNNTLLFVNPAFCETYGYAEEELIGKNIEIVRSSNNPPQVIDAIIPGTMAGEWNGEVLNRRKDGTEFAVELWTSVVRNDAGEPIALVGIARDISDRRRSEEILRQSENKFRSLLENSSDGIAMLGSDGIIKYVSSSTTRFLGYSTEELLNRSFAEFVHPDDVPQASADFAKLFSHPDDPSVALTRVRHKDGSWRWIESTRRNLLNEPSVNAVVANFRDVTERRLAEAEKQSSLALFYSLVDHMQSGILVETEDRRISVINKSFCEIFSISQKSEELIGVHCADAAEHSKHLLAEPEQFVSRISELIRDRQMVLGEEIHFANRQVHERNYIPIYSGSGEFVGHLWQYRDVTARKQAESIQSAVYQIAQAADKSPSLDALYHSVHEIISSIMPATNFYIALYDEKENMISFPYFVDEVDPPMLPKKAGKGLTEYILRTGQPLLCSMTLHEEMERRGELELIGSPSPIWLGVPLIVEKKTIGVMAVQHYADEQAYGANEQNMLEFVSSQVAKAIDRKRVEEELRESRERFSKAFYSSPHAITISGLDNGHYIDINESFLRLVGYTRDEVIGHSSVDLSLWLETADREKVAELLAQQGSIRNIQTEFRVRSGEIRVWNSSLEVIELSGQRCILSMIEDVTEHKRAAELLQASEARYRTLFEESQDGIFLSTPDGRLIDVNPAGMALFGYSSREELLKVDIARDLYFNSEDREIFKYNLARQGFVLDFEFIIKRKNGEKRIVLESASAMRNDQGNIVAYRSFIRDVTERKKLEDQLRQAQKMEGIGTLAGGIAHDFNNLLGIILGYTTLIESGSLEQQKLKQSIETIKKAVERGANLVRQLLTFARKADPAFESVNLNETVVELVKMLQQTFPKTINIVTEIDEQMPSIVADTTQLHQALLNLSVNARDAMIEGSGATGIGALTFQTGVIPGSSVRHKFGTAGADDYAYIKVKDTGNGMDEATRQRIFEPFFTTKELGKGTGLGLAVVYGVVNSHHGFIDVESEQGKGTTFTLFLPVQSRKIIEAPPEVEKAQVTTGGSETVLLVEDEEMLRELLKNLLEEQGYHVLAAGDGQEGLEIYQTKKDQIAVILSDMGLPRLGGWEMFQKMRELNPKVRAILASGYFDPNLKIDMLKAGAKDFIQKPYVSEEILKRIREVIDQEW